MCYVTNQNHTSQTKIRCALGGLRAPLGVQLLHVSSFFCFCVRDPKSTSTTSSAHPRYVTHAKPSTPSHSVTYSSPEVPLLFVFSSF